MLEVYLYAMRRHGAALFLCFFNGYFFFRFAFFVYFFEFNFTEANGTKNNEICVITYEKKEIAAIANGI